jgi:PAS domain S-box-containing protein
MSDDKAQNELLSQLCNHAMDILALMDGGGRLLFVNPAVRNVLGYEPDQLVNRLVTDWIHPADAPQVAEEIRRTLEGTSTRITMEVRCRHNDGSWRTLEVAGSPLPDAANPRLAITARDISHRRRSEDLQHAVDRMADATRDARTPAELFAAAHRILRDLVPADNFFVALQDPETGWLSFPYWVDRRDPGPTAHPPGRGMTEFVIQNNRSLHLTPESLPTFLAGSGAELLGSCPLEWIGCPLRSTDRVLGALVLQSYEASSALGTHALKVLEVLATPLVLALNSLAQEEARKDSEQSYQLLFAEMHAAFLVVELQNGTNGTAPHAHLVECNAALERLLLRPRSQLVGRRLADVLAPESPAWVHQLSEINRTGAPMVQHDWPSPHLQRHMTVHGYRISAGRVACLAEDISERKQSEKALQRRDALLEALAFTAERFLRTTDWEECVQDVLAAMGQAADVSRVYIFQLDCTPQSRLVASQRYEWVAEGITSQLANPRLQELDVQNPEWADWLKELREGRLVAGHVSQFTEAEKQLFLEQQVQSVLLVPVFAGGFLWGIIGCDECRNVRSWMSSEKDAFRSAAQTLGEAIQRLRAEESMRVRSAALASAANGIVITDHTGHIIFVNQAFQNLTGYTAGEVLGHTPAILKSGQHNDAFYRQMWQHMNDGKVWRGELTNRRKDGRLYQEEMTITPVRNPAGKVTHYIAIKQDISERRNLQQQLQQAQKMESIGRLAGGIAHDFNNLLQAITGFSSILMTDLGEGDPRRGMSRKLTGPRNAPWR